MNEPEEGRELDATVALDVMGWKRHEWREHRALQHTVFCPKCGNTKARVALADFYAFCGASLIPRYSTDWSAAFEVIVKINELKLGWFALEQLAESPRETWKVTIWTGNGEERLWEYSKSLPLTICRVALRLVES